MMQFSIKMLKKERKKHTEIGAHPGIDPGPLALEPTTLTTRPRGQVMRSFNNRPNSRDSATFVFVTRVIMYVVCFRLSYIYLSLVQRVYGSLCFELLPQQMSQSKKKYKDLCQHANKYKQVVLETLS